MKYAAPGFEGHLHKGTKMIVLCEYKVTIIFHIWKTTLALISILHIIEHSYVVKTGILWYFGQIFPKSPVHLTKNRNVRKKIKILCAVKWPPQYKSRSLASQWRRAGQCHCVLKWPRENGSKPYPEYDYCSCISNSNILSPLTMSAYLNANYLNVN